MKRMKTEVYSWRVWQEVKTELEREARRRKMSAAALIEVAARELLIKAPPRVTEAGNRRGFNRRLSNVLGLWKAATLIVWRRYDKKSGGDYGSVMAARGLIDAGAILALLVRKDRWHEVCVEAFPQLRLPFLTSEAVLTELFHLVRDSRGRQMEAARRLVRSGAATLAAIEHALLGLSNGFWGRHAGVSGESGVRCRRGLE